MKTNKGNFQLWLGVGTILLILGVPQFSAGSTTGVLAALVFLAGSAGAFYQAFAEKRRAEQESEVSRPAAAEEPREPGRPQ